MEKNREMFMENAGDIFFEMKMSLKQMVLKRLLLLILLAFFQSTAVR